MALPERGSRFDPAGEAASHAAGERRYSSCWRVYWRWSARWRRGYYFAMRPVTLRIAVGPANSDDLKVVQALTQAFTQEHSQVRLRPIQTDGAAASAKVLAEGKADLAIIRGDLDVPKNAQAVATLRKNVAVLWVPPPAKGKGKKAGCEDHQDLAACRPPRRRRRPHPGQCQSAEGDPAAIRRRSGQGRDHPVPGQRGR